MLHEMNQIDGKQFSTWNKLCSFSSFIVIFQMNFEKKKTISTFRPFQQLPSIINQTILKFKFRENKSW